MKKYYGKICMFGAILAGGALSAVPAEPYTYIQNFPQTYAYVQDAYIYYNLAKMYNAAVIIDVESQDGSVARYLAQQSPTLPSLQQIYSVNIWQSCDPSQKQLFRRFLSNVIQDNTTQWITPIRMNSHEAAEALSIQADLINLVGKNDQNTIYNDILDWFPHLSATGILCGNNWYEPAIQVGVTRAAEKLNMSVQINDNVWYFVKGS